MQLQLFGNYQTIKKPGTANQVTIKQLEVLFLVGEERLELSRFLATF